MAGRKIKDANDARRCVSAADASGMTLTEWARDEGIDARSLHAWRMNLKLDKKTRRSKTRPTKSAAAKTRGSARMVELVPSVSVSRPQATRARYAVRCGALSIELGEDFEDETLRRLVRVVASC